MENITESEHEESSTDDLQKKQAALHAYNFKHTVEGCGTINKAKVDVFLALFLLFL